MTIYAEYLFLENFLIGWILLALTASIGGVKSKRSRIAVGAALCGLYSFFIFIPMTGLLFPLASKLLFSSLLILLVFWKKGGLGTQWRMLTRQLLLFYLISFLLGGATLALLLLTSTRSVSNQAVIYIGEIRIIQIACGIFLGYQIIRYFVRVLREQRNAERRLVTLSIRIGEQETQIRALLDTANFLRDPISGKLVLIVEQSTIQMILPEDWQNRVRLIPYASLGNRNGMLPGIRPDSVSTVPSEDSDSTAGSSIQLDVILGLVADPFRKGFQGEKYQGLLNPEALQPKQ